MGECWGYLREFVRYVLFIFVFNLDIWEFVKVYFGVYIGFLNFDIFIFLENIGVNYGYYLIGWIIGIGVVGCGFLIVYVVLFY